MIKASHDAFEITQGSKLQAHHKEPERTPELRFIMGTLLDGHQECVLATPTRNMFELWSLVERFRVFG